MSLGNELQTQVKKILREQWSIRDGNKVPEEADLQLGNDAVRIDATVLYADMKESTVLVDTQKAHFAAEVYKSFLFCSAKIISAEGGAITAYDGDRVMGVFIGDWKDTLAARAALKIHHATRNIINPALKAQYPQTAYVLKHVAGVDTGSLLVARTGIRGSNDLVWVGRAANHAAKLCTLNSDYPSWITAEVYAALHNSLKLTNGQSMWELRTWTAMNNRNIYRSNWSWPC